MPSPIRPQFFCSRPNGTMTPLIALDELPTNISIRGVHRHLSPHETAGMTSVGTAEHRSQLYIVDGVQLGPIGTPAMSFGGEPLLNDSRQGIQGGMPHNGVPNWPMSNGQAPGGGGNWGSPQTSPTSSTHKRVSYQAHPAEHGVEERHSIDISFFTPIESETHRCGFSKSQKDLLLVLDPSRRM